jgi:PAS domain S-box-containing protein
MALLLALSILYSFLTRIWKREEMTGQILAGLLFGGVAVAGMMNPFHYSPGVIFDGRSILVSMAGLFGGPATAAIASAIASVYRLWLGGAEAMTGVGVIITSAALGVVYHYIHRKRSDVIKPLYLFGFGVVVHVGMLLWMLTLPWPLAFEVLGTISIPVMVVFPIATLFLGTLLADQKGRIYAEDALRESENRFRKLTELLPEAVYEMDTGGKLTYVNQKALDQFGYTHQDFESGLNAVDMISPGDQQKAMDNIQKILNGEKMGLAEYTAKKADGTLFPVMLHSTVVYRQEKVAGLRGIIVDISDRKRKEESIHRHNKYLSALHDISLDMFNRMKVDDLLKAIIIRASELTKIPDGFLHLHNQKENVLEIKAACGQLAPRLGFQIKPGDGLAGKVWESKKPIIIDNYSTWSERDPGPGFDEMTSTISVPLLRGAHIEGVIGLSHHEAGKKIDPEIISILEQFAELAVIAIDNSRLYDELSSELKKSNSLQQERDKIESQLRQAQKMESIGTLAGGIAHDFNNILFAIMGYTELALDSVERETPLYENLQEVFHAANRAKDLVKQILTFSRQTEQERQPVQVKLIVNEALKLLRASLPSTIEVGRNIKSDALVMADPTQIHQILLNLCANAEHAMREKGGVLKVELENVELDADFTARHPDMTPGAYLYLTVGDTGHGMPPDVLARIFDPFFTTKETGEGTGMGLSVVHGIIGSYGGAITAYSEPGQGSTFKVYLPIIERRKEPRAEAEESIPTGSERILFVDDELALANLGKQTLESLGYDVDIRTGSIEALELFKNKPDRFDLVITDMTMPNMTGEDLAQELMHIKPNIPIILCTGFSAKIDDQKASAMGIRAFALKPIVRQKIATTIRKVLDQTLEKNQGL